MARSQVKQDWVAAGEQLMVRRVLSACHVGSSAQ
jgi:hypothetical protein